MRKAVFILQLFLLSFIVIGSNAENHNKFEKFSIRMSLARIPFYNLFSTEKGQDDFFAQLNVGNYLSFSPTRSAYINSYEFFSDVLESDFYVYETNKKGKIKDKSQIFKYDDSDFFVNYRKGISGDKAEVKALGIVVAGVKVHNAVDEYKITRYSAARGVLIQIPVNIAFYIKKVSDTKLVWSKTDDYKVIDYTFTLENGKITVKDGKGTIITEIYRKGDSLFIDRPKSKEEIRVNKELSQFEYYTNGKNKSTVKYAIVK
ncbi:MAG: oligoendopeptidase [Leptotrichiaceae bacterium]|nr:oligoendopeptidase [Leptotrichiaceae bacterium]